MELKIDDKEFSKELANLAYESLARYIEREDGYVLWYNDDIAKSVKTNVDKLFAEHKDYILNAIVEKCAEKYMKQVNLLTVLTALSDKKGE